VAFGSVSDDVKEVVLRVVAVGSSVQGILKGGKTGVALGVALASCFALLSINIGRVMRC
jgi:hypothetical protein